LSRIFCTGLFSGTKGPLEPVLKRVFLLVLGLFPFYEIISFVVVSLSMHVNDQVLGTNT
jgi:hypothetical protein